MKHVIITALIGFLASQFSFAQSFSNASELLGNDYNSGGVVGVVDMDQDGYDDIVILNDSRNVFIEYQEGDGSFSDFFYGAISGSGQWGATAGDINNDGHNDIFSGGSYDGVHHMIITSRGSATMTGLDEGNMFMQACNLADIDNDGWLDAFACHDDAESRIWGNNGAGSLVPQNDWIDMTTTPVSDNSGNYGSVWCDFDNDGDLDLYIAKCRQNVVNPNDPRRINALFVNDGNGNFTEEAAERGLVIFEQSWTVDFADIDNDNDFDCFLTNHSGTLRLLENNGTGYFSDITEGSGLEYSGFFLQAKLEDFNNDGFVDLLYSGGTHNYLQNNGDKTFSVVPNAFPADDTMHSFGIGDLNHDGFMDVYASYGNTYISADFGNDDILWLNDGNDNNWVGFDLEGTVSNINAIGARVEIYGDFGVQVREVRAGESYGITTSFKTHFGLAQHESIDYAVIRFPSGIINVIENPGVNTYHEVIETECDGPAVPTITSETGLALCQGESTILETNSSADFIWSNGSTAQSIEVSEPGTYTVTALDNGCGTESESALIEVVILSSAELTVEGQLKFCEGGQVTLSAPESSSYEWSNGENEQAIEVESTGEYSVTIDSGTNCGDVQSVPIFVEVLDAPAVPLISDELSDDNGDVTFSADSENVQWFDFEDSTEPISEGMEFTTNIGENSTFYAQSFMQYGGESYFGGRFDNDGPGAYQDNSGYWNVFDVYENMILVSVKVYSDADGMRTIQVIDNEGNVIQSGMFDIPVGESRVELNFFIPEGTQYGIRTQGNPQLWRNSIGTDLDYPYEMGDVAAVTGTNITGGNEFNYYYFFYEWEVETESFFCTSDRIPVQAIFNSVDEIEELESLNVYPNPAMDVLNINYELLRSNFIQVELRDLAGRVLLRKDLGNLGSGSYIEQIDLNNVSNGMYLLNFNVNGKRATKRVVVEK